MVKTVNDLVAMGYDKDEMEQYGSGSMVEATMKNKQVLR